MRAPPLALLLPLLLAACSSYDAASPGGDASPEDAALDADASFRLDVFPSVSPAETSDGGEAGDLLPQTFQVQADAGPVVLALREPVDVTGILSAYAVSPYAFGASLPGAEVDLDALVTLHRSDSVQSRSGPTDDDGAFALTAVPGDGYRLSVRPRSPDLPFYTEYLDLTGDLDLDLDLGAGAPVWGRVTTGSGAPIASVEVFLESVHGDRTTSVETRSDGTYQLRVSPGAYRVVAAGRTNGRDPTLVSDLKYIDAEGRSIDLSYATFTFHAVGGRIVTTSGVRLRDGGARFIARELEGYPEGADLVVETRADQHGNFDTRLLPGTYDVELYPRDDQEVSPVRLTDVPIDGTTDLGTTGLPPFSALSGVVLDGAGVPVPGAVVACREDGFAHRTFTGATDELGGLSLVASRAPLRCSLSPPASQVGALALTRFEADGADSDLGEMVFERGQLLEGRVLRGGRPLGLALVEVRDAKGQLLGTALSSDDEGTFSVRVSRRR